MGISFIPDISAKSTLEKLAIMNKDWIKHITGNVSNGSVIGVSQEKFKNVLDYSRIFC